MRRDAAATFLVLVLVKWVLTCRNAADMCVEGVLAKSGVCFVCCLLRRSDTGHVCLRNRTLVDLRISFLDVMCLICYVMCV